MVVTIIQFLRGFLGIELTGPYIERFINLCVRQGIYLWHLRKVGENRATVRISVAGFRRIREAARKTKTRVRIMQRRGLPLFLHRHRRRRAFFVGMILFAVIILGLSSFVWAIEIEDTEKIDKNLIRNTLKSCGLDVGVLKYKVKASKVQSDMLREMPELSWLWVEIKGTRAFVHVREKTPVPEIVPLSHPANIVAESDGVIVSCTATRGGRLVQEGEAVRRGQLLISGTVETKHGGTLLVHAEGTVRAKTWKKQSGTFPLTKRIETETGQRRTQYSVVVGKQKLPLYGKNPPFEAYRTETESRTLKLWGDLYLPVALEKSILIDTDIRYERLSPQEAENHYGSILLKEIEIPADGELINTEYTHILNGDGTITVTCIAECEEEIGQTREILEERENDGTIF